VLVFLLALWPKVPDMITPNKFWRNSDMFVFKVYFLAQKMAKLEYVSEISQNFMKK